MQTFITSRQWIEHYRTNAVNQLPIPWDVGAKLTSAEIQAIIVSLQAWQLGETSEGKHLLEAVRRYTAKQNDPEFLTVVELFIAEENRHGELLGRFLDLQGAGRIKRNWGDSIFRRLRYCLPNMEVWTTVVIVVETFALIYYRAVMNATDSPVLRTICRQILKDEVYHLRFQYERLAQMHARRNAIALKTTYWIQQVLFVGTLLAVWIGHHRALNAGGYPFQRFWRASWKRMRFHWQQMQHVMPGTAYHGPNPNRNLISQIRYQK